MLKRDELMNPESCLNKAENDELLFILLERDPAASVAIRAWVNERIRLRLNTLKDPKIQNALDCAEMMETLSSMAPKRRKVLCQVVEEEAPSQDGKADQK